MTDFSGKHSFLESIRLNSIQKNAVTYTQGPQLVFAGAGTGKTRVLTAKIAFLIKETGLFPNHIFAATFTNKAAREMRERVERLIEISCNGLWIGTFHSLCARILRREAAKIGYTSNFTIYDDNDQVTLIKKVMKEMNIEERTMQPRHLLRLISNFKNSCKSFEEIDGAATSFFQREVIAAYGSYQKALKQAQAMDFDDLLTNTVFLFRRHADVLGAYQNQFRYVLVDEYQDTNLAQFYLVKMLAAAHHKVFVVGDDDQSIYSWRGAQIENILSFDTVFPGTKVFVLEENYRSTQAILEFANAIISGNVNRAKKKLWTSRSSEARVTVNRFRDDRQEAEAVAEEIGNLISAGAKAGEIAILFRTNAQSRVFEDSLRKRNILYVLVGGTSFYERKEVKDCLAYLRLLVNPNDSVSCERILNVPARGIGAKTEEQLSAAAKSRGISLFEYIMNGAWDDTTTRARAGLEDFSALFSLLGELNQSKASLREILSQMLAISGYVEMLETEETEEAHGRLENINELLNALTVWGSENPDGTLGDFLEEVTLVSDIDGWDQRENAVNMMTLHAAKGLEFSQVFLVGLEDGLIPSRQNFDDPEKLEEECRLMYVGSTRAKDTLFASYADMRMRFGTTVPMPPSRYLERVPPELFRFIDRSMQFRRQPDLEMAAPAAKRVVYAQQRRVAPVVPQFDEFNQETVQYRTGQIVTHGKYGRGKILAISGFGPDMQLTVLFKDGNRKKMMAQFANLKSGSEQGEPR
jgi:DNA helicase-2/ATP-dependent DNA helicase PcrA